MNNNNILLTFKMHHLIFNNELLYISQSVQEKCTTLDVL